MRGSAGTRLRTGWNGFPKVLALHPAVAVGEFGGNDGLRGLRIEDTRANLDQIVQTLKGAGVKIALAWNHAAAGLWRGLHPAVR